MNAEFKKSEKICIWIIFTVMGLLALSIMLPVFWAIYASFKGRLDYAFDPVSFPKKMMWENYVKIYEHLKVSVTTESGQKQVDFAGMFTNSVVYSSLESLMSVLMPGVLGYIVAMYRFKGREFIQGLNVFIMTIPIITSLAASLRVLKNFGIYDNMLLYVFTQNGAFGFNFLLFYGAFKGLSWTYAEAAFLDGAGHFKVMVKIMWPMMLPTFAMMFVLSFVNSWNTYETFLIYLPSFPNLFLGMYYYQNSASINYATPPEILAGLILVAIPSGILYASSQKLLRSRFIIGGIKG